MAVLLSDSDPIHPGGMCVNGLYDLPYFPKPCNLASHHSYLKVAIQNMHCMKHKKECIYFPSRKYYLVKIILYIYVDFDLIFILTTPAK